MEAHTTNTRSKTETHLRDYWQVIWSGRYTVLTIVLLVLGVAVLHVALATPTYLASAVLEIKPEPRRILNQESLVGSEGRSWIAEEFYFNTQLEVLKSRDLAERVFHSLQLSKHPAFAELPDPVGVFQAKVRVRPRINTRLVELSMLGTDPREVTEWVNALASVYVQRNIDNATQSFGKIMDGVRQSLVGFRRDIEGANVGQIDADGGSELYVPQDQKEILRKRLEDYNRSMTEVQGTIGSLTAELQSLERMRREGQDLSSLPRIAQDLVIEDLNSKKLTIERDLEQLALQKKPTHPEYLHRLSDLEKVKNRIDERASKLGEDIYEERRLARSTEANLLQLIRQANEEAVRVSRLANSYELASTDAESKRKVLDVVTETMSQLSLGAQLISTNNNVSILDRAISPRSPVRPRKAMSLVFGVTVGLLLGVGAVLFLDYLDNTIRSPEDIEQYLGVGILAMIPKYREPESNIVREAFQSLRTSILFSSGNREKRILMFTSAGPQEGKSSTVELIARSLASGGDRVVVVDCDLRRPTQHKHLKASREPGVTNYLLDGTDGEVGPFVQQVDSPNLHLMASGPIPPNPAELVGTRKFREMLQVLKRQFDWVIVDTPPVASLADSVVLASLVEMSVLVIKNNHNDRDLIHRCLKRLRDVDVSVAGAVLNMVDLEGTYYSKYSYMYSYSEPNEAEGKKSRRRLGRGSRSKDEADGKKIAL